MLKVFFLFFFSLSKTANPFLCADDFTNSVHPPDIVCSPPPLRYSRNTSEFSRWKSVMHRLGWVVRGGREKWKRNIRTFGKERQNEREMEQRRKEGKLQKPRNSARSFFSSFGYRTFLVLSVSNLRDLYIFNTEAESILKKVKKS